MPDPVVTGDEHGGDDADEHERRTGHRVQEELRGRVDPPLVSPAADEEVHRHEHDLEEQEEHEQVEAEEGAHHACLEQQHPGEVRLVVVVRVDPDERQGEEHTGEHDEEEGDAVDAEVPGDPPRLDPRVLRHELVAGFTGLEGDESHTLIAAVTAEASSATSLVDLRPPARDDRDEECSSHRHGDQRGEDRE